MTHIDTLKICQPPFILFNSSKGTGIYPNGVILVGYNPTVYAPHFYTKEEVASLPISIVGKVVELRRSL